MSNYDNPHTLCERLRRLYLRLEEEGKAGSDEWKAACELYDRIGSRRQLDSDVEDAETLLAQPDTYPAPLQAEN